MLTQRFGLRYVASGDVLRAARASGTELGNTVKSYLDAGELVPDEVTIQLLLEEIMKDTSGVGVILDGFPRTLAQAKALDQALAERQQRIDVVIELTAPLDVLVERVTGRLICRAAGHIYHERTRPPRVAGKCDIDGSKLYRREDDYPEAIRRRLAIWAEQNEQLVLYYGVESAFFRVDANRAPEVVQSDLAKILIESGLRTVTKEAS